MFVLISNAQQNSSDLYSTQNLYGTRTFALSGSNSAISNTSQDAFANPASIDIIIEEISVIVQPYIVDTYFYHLSYGNKFKDYNYAFNISGYVSSDFEKRDVDGVLDGHYTNNEIIFSGTIKSKKLIDLVETGLTMKFVNSRLFEYTSNGLLFDIGFLYDLTKNQKIAFTLSDISLFHSNYNLETESKVIYRNFGYSYNFEKIPIRFLFNNKSSDKNGSINTYGVIFGLKNIEINISYNNDIASSFNKESKREVLNGFAFGIALNNNDLKYHFAYKSLSDFGSHYAFGITKTLN